MRTKTVTTLTAAIIAITGITACGTERTGEPGFPDLSGQTVTATQSATSATVETGDVMGVPKFGTSQTTPKGTVITVAEPVQIVASGDGKPAVLFRVTVTAPKTEQLDPLWTSVEAMRDGVPVSSVLDDSVKDVWDLGIIRAGRTVKFGAVFPGRLAGVWDVDFSTGVDKYLWSGSFTG